MGGWGGVELGRLATGRPPAIGESLAVPSRVFRVTLSGGSMVYTLVIIREARRRSVFCVRDANGVVVYRSFKRADAVGVQLQLNRAAA